jgi:hypothetical protein
MHCASFRILTKHCFRNNVKGIFNLPGYLLVGRCHPRVHSYRYSAFLALLQQIMFYDKETKLIILLLLSPG